MDDQNNDDRVPKLPEWCKILNQLVEKASKVQEIYGEVEV